MKELNHTAIKSINIVTIDPSITCTSLNINDKKFVFTVDNVSKEKKGYKKWFSRCENFCEIKSYPEIFKDADYSSSEINKLSFYSSVVFDIISTIKNNIDATTETKIYMEGYSQSSLHGPIIDLVSFSSILRYNLYSSISKDITIISPLSLKLIAAKLYYVPIIKGKKIEYRNEDGIAGGKFTKVEIYKSLLKANKNDPWINFLLDNSEYILSKKKIPKPIEDINDAKILYEYAKSNK